MFIFDTRTATKTRQFELSGWPPELLPAHNTAVCARHRGCRLQHFAVGGRSEMPQRASFPPSRIFPPLSVDKSAVASSKVAIVRAASVAVCGISARWVRVGARAGSPVGQRCFGRCGSRKSRCRARNNNGRPRGPVRAGALKPRPGRLLLAQPANSREPERTGQNQRRDLLIELHQNLGLAPGARRSRATGEQGRWRFVAGAVRWPALAANCCTPKQRKSESSSSSSNRHKQGERENNSFVCARLARWCNSASASKGCRANGRAPRFSCSLKSSAKMSKFYYLLSSGPK